MKKKLIKASSLFILLVMLLTSCYAFPIYETSNSTSIVLSKTNLSFHDVGEVAEITAAVIEDGVLMNDETAKSKLVWTTTNPAVAIVDSGTVTAVGYGSCVVRASCDGYSAFCTVNNPNPNPPLSISKTEIILDNIGAEITINATSDSGDNISSIASWRSSNENIAVCEDGIITAMGYGSCTITALYQRKTAVCIVTVKNPTAPSVTLSSSSLSLVLGESHTLKATTDNNAGSSIIWKSSDPSIASCDGGVIKARSNGTCAIIAITELGYSDVCIVTSGSGDKKIEHASYLDFKFPDIGKELQCIDKSVGQISSAVTVIGYKMTTLLLSDGRLVVEISLICMKTYDKDGLNGTNPGYVTTTLYRENDTFCDKRIYKTENLSVGDVFTVKCSGFTVQTKTDGTARELYMTFSTITEK